jgi:hypothetical protein
VLEVGISSIEVSALPEDLIGHLSIDVSGMQIIDVKHVSDLELPRVYNSSPIRPRRSSACATLVSLVALRTPPPTRRWLPAVTNDSSSPEEAQTGV